MIHKPSTEFVHSITSIPDTNIVGAALDVFIHQDGTQNLLRQRHMLAMLARHGSKVEQSLRTIDKEKGLHRSSQLGVFVLTGYDQQPVGMATVNPLAKLKRQRVQLPPYLAKGPLSYPIVTHGPKVSAWVAPIFGERGTEVLTAAYRLLSDPEGPAKHIFETYVALESLDIAPPPQAWTIEPLQSPDKIRRAIRMAGFQKVDAGYYDDHSSARVSPPIAALYTRSTEANA